MAKKSLIPDDLQGEWFLSKKAGSFSNTPQRTVQLWTEKGAISPEKDTGGPGDRRRYSVLNCIEIGIIKALSDDRVPFNQISFIMRWLKFEGRLQRILEYDNGYLALQILPNRISEDDTCAVLYFNDGERIKRKDKDEWGAFTTPKSSDKTLIVNINRIARRVIAAME